MANENNKANYSFTKQESHEDLLQRSEELGTEIIELIKENGFEKNHVIRSKEKTKQKIDDRIAAIEDPDKSKDNQPELPFR